MRDSGGMLPVRYGRSIDLGSSVYESNAEHEFVLWTVAASSEDAGKFKYQLPDNVVEVHEVFLQDALKLASVKKKYKFTERELKALTDFVHCQRPDWNVLFEMYNDRKISPMSFLTSSEFLDILTAICQRDYPYTAFSDMFHTMRSMFLPVLYVLGRRSRKRIFIIRSPPATAVCWPGWEAINIRSRLC